MAVRYVEEFRDPAKVKALAGQIAAMVTRPWTIMEICGGQTHAILRFGLDQLLPKEISLIHGPGCPVCVTPVELIDRAIAVARRPEVILCSFGDMLRVPGSAGDLLAAKAEGADVRVVYSPLDAVEIARKNPSRQVVFFAVGFETTAPANAMAVLHAFHQRLRNFSVLVAHVLVPPAVEAILASGAKIDGFLAAGHVCTVMGIEEYEPIAERFRVPIVVTGFEPLDILQGLAMCLRQLESGEARVEIQYDRSVRPEGNQAAKQVILRVFEITDRKWRGIGLLPRSGLKLREEFRDFDAEVRFNLGALEREEEPGCIAGLVLQGKARPTDCPFFGTKCTPDHPLGAPMVSSEGACAAYFRYRRTGL
ncbi:MAG: hydrogenase formation protein HypD [Thermoguttaceae bacterium]|nr:hydrogenase formation protein HypD [Thermoguttaceae bacterium]MDW8078720.1 hydrogenase formation protein HypD [Thermoguttaceae bacterium]